MQALSRWAREFRILISAGIAERVGPVLYNSQLVIGPDGILGKQRKLHMSRDEYFFFRGGSEFSVIDISKAKLGIVICYDIMHPETARILSFGVVIRSAITRATATDRPAGKSKSLLHV